MASAGSERAATAVKYADFRFRAPTLDHRWPISLYGSVDVAGLSFTLRTESGSTITVKWSDSTFFDGITPQTLSGREVEVEGVLENGVLLASKIGRSD